jgi:RNA polymerase sigma-70 factor (ECF subfamily)
MQACWFEPNLEGEVDGKMVSRWIERLPDLQRQVVVARIWGELTFQQIADLVDRPTATVFRYYRESLESIRLEMNQSDGRIA